MASPLNPFNLGLFDSGTYSPFICDIIAVTQAQQATITTSVDHGFTVGNQIQCFIPKQYGMRQLNNLKGYVTAVPSVTEITVTINTLTFDPFVVPTLPALVVIDPAQVSGIGDSNVGASAPGGVTPLPNTVPGAFENQPPS